jgi:hypothetical protein
MDNAKVGAVKDLLARHGRNELLDDPRRCEALLKDTNLSASETASMMGALKQGIPQRLSTQLETVVPGAMIAKYAHQLSDMTALKYEAAYGAIAMWSAALGLVVPDPDPPARPDVGAPSPPVAGGAVPPISGGTIPPATADPASVPQINSAALMFMPWKPVASLQQARTLTIIGTVCLAINSVLALAMSGSLGAVGVVFALIYAGAAVGTFLKSRVAAGIGLGFYVFNLLAALVGQPATLVAFFIWGPLVLGTLAGLRGTMMINNPVGHGLLFRA